MVVKSAPGFLVNRVLMPYMLAAVERVEASVLEEVVVTDTIPLREDALRCGKFKVLSVSRLLGEAIKRIHHSDSVSSLFV